MSEPETSGPGSVLRAEREALGVTVREVAETLNLSMTMIEAIEADDLDRLPGPVFARGYVRAYARLLELDPEPLMADYPPASDTVPTVEAARESPVWEWIRRRPGLVLGSAAGLLALLIAVLLVVWLGSGGAGGAPEGVSTGAASPTDVTAADPIAEAAPPDAESPAGAVIPAPVARADGSGGRARPDVPSSEPAEPATTGAVASGGGARRITASGDDRLAFTFSDDCWVEVRDAAGRTRYSDLNRADSELMLVGQGPFRILLGYAPGVQLRFNGEAVPLTPHTRDNVATLVLGQ